MKLSTFFGENIRVSYASILSNRLRTMLTMAIIAIGIMSLVGIITAIESIKSSMTESFSSMGAGSFSIQNYRLVGDGMSWTRQRNDNRISYNQAVEFKERFSIPSTISLSMGFGGSTEVKYRSLKTNPNVRMAGIDEDWMKTNSYEIEFGRNFTGQEVESARYVVIIGSAVAELLFPNESPQGKYVNIGGGQYMVVGVLAHRGSGMGMARNDDLRIFVPITTGRGSFTAWNPSVMVTVVPNNPNLRELSMSEAEGLFRSIRRLSAQDETDFSIESSDSLLNILKENMSTVTLVATLVGLITLLGAAVGLMNIMLVSVNERTREIGTRMALGAKPRMIRQQFLFESIIISQMGGIFGIVLGILCGNVISLIIGGGFVVPWLWIFIGVVLCLGVGVGSGYLPARRAAGLDPVEALRYE